MGKASLKKAEALRAKLEKIGKKADRIRRIRDKKRARAKTKAEKECLNDKYSLILYVLDEQYERASMAHRAYLKKYLPQEYEKKYGILEKKFETERRKRTRKKTAPSRERLKG